MTDAEKRVDELEYRLIQISEITDEILDSLDPYEDFAIYYSICSDLGKIKKLASDNDRS